MITSDKVVPEFAVICSAQKAFRYCLLIAISVMAAIPYGAMAACKAMKKTPEMDLKVSTTTPASGFELKFGNNRKVLENPVKYNGKMMNSIWGLYNRLSPHNIKKSCDAKMSFNYGQDQQQGKYN